MTTPPVHVRTLALGMGVARGLRTHGAFEAAAAIAFWFFLSLVPLLVLLGFLVGQIARVRGVDALAAPLLEVVPPGAEDIVRKEVVRMAGSASTLAPLGVVGYFWTASSGLHALMDVFENAAATRLERRPWWKQRAIALAWVAAGLATACVLAWTLVRVDAALNAREIAAAGPVVSAVATPAVATPAAAPRLPAGERSRRTEAPPSSRSTRLRSAFRRRVHRALHAPAEQAIASALLLALGLVFLAGFYRFAVEHPPGVRRRVWPGAVTAVASWLLVSWIFGLYAVSATSYALYYGSLAAVAVLLVWLYLTSFSLVVGAEVNVQLEGVGGRV